MNAAELQTLLPVNLTLVSICDAGIIAGFLSVGGSLVMSAVVMQAGLHPIAMAATLQATVLPMGIAQLAIYGSLGAVPWQMAAVMFVIGIATTVLGQLTLGRYTRRRKKAGLVVALVALAGVSALALALYQLVISVRAAVADTSLFTTMRGVCAA